MTNYRNALLDVLVRAQDVAVPLSQDLPMPIEAAPHRRPTGLDDGPFWARRRLRSFRLVATDTDWSAGDGALVEGPIAALLLLLTGRTALLDRLSGPGAGALWHGVGTGHRNIAGSLWWST